MTTWARAGLYDVDFGLGSRVRYADGVVPRVDGCVLIVDSAPRLLEEVRVDGGRMDVGRGWTGNGVDVTIPLRREDMERLLGDPGLLPEVEG